MLARTARPSRGKWPEWNPVISVVLRVTDATSVNTHCGTMQCNVASPWRGQVHPHGGRDTQETSGSDESGGPARGAHSVSSIGLCGDHHARQVLSLQAVSLQGYGFSAQLEQCLPARLIKALCVPCSGVVHL